MESETTASGKPEGQIQIVAQSHCKSGSWVVTDIFRCGRDFAAWVGLVPKQHSSGGKARLGKISKEGQVDIRRLLIIGAMTRIAWVGRKPIQDGSWLDRMLKRKPKMLVAIALANKMARTIWAVLTKQEDYRDPVKPAAA